MRSHMLHIRQLKLTQVAQIIILPKKILKYHLTRTNHQKMSSHKKILFHQKSHMMIPTMKFQKHLLQSFQIRTKRRLPQHMMKKKRTRTRRKKKMFQNERKTAQHQEQLISPYHLDQQMEELLLLQTAIQQVKVRMSLLFYLVVVCEQMQVVI